MRLKSKDACRLIFEEIWNDDDHGRLPALIGSGSAVDDYDVAPDRPASLALIDLVNTYKAFVPDLRFTLLDQVKEGRTVVTYWSARGRHSGMAVGIAPTGKGIELHGALVAKTTAGGAIEQVRGTWGVRSFIQQLGLRERDFDRAFRLGPNEIRIRAIHERSGTPLLLFPTMSLPGWMTWRRFVDVLRSERPVLTFQLLANRKAYEDPALPTDYDLKIENGALLSALDTAGTEGPFDIVGHSAGGTLALDFALDHPKLVRSLTLIEPGLAWLLEASGAMNEKLRRFLRRRLAKYSAEMTPAKYASFLKETFLEKGFNPRKHRWGMMRAYMRNMHFRPALFSHMDDPRRLQAVDYPVLIIRGRDSDEFHRAVTEALKSALPHAELVEMPGGHLPHCGAGITPFLAMLGRFHQFGQALPPATPQPLTGAVLEVAT